MSLPVRPPAPSTPPLHPLQSKAFLLLLVVVTLAFGVILLPFYGGIFWGMVLAILFAPLYRYVLRLTRQRATIAALVTLGLILVIVVLPLIFIVSALVKETASVYLRIQSGELNRHAATDF